ncbi:MAG: HlyD family secretion protein [Geobacteraceae bacterium]|nr:HlyD family secretion protein [Geobacteraceae bacterium]
MKNQKLKLLVKVGVTVTIFTSAVLISIALWNRYMHSPWTRDGRVRASVINVAPDVSGTVVSMAVHDNQLVHKGDLLFTIDQKRYQLALARAEAHLESRRAEKKIRYQEAERRAELGDEVVSHENKENSRALAETAEALYQEAKAERDLAKLNLKRTEVRSPVEGYITNLAVYAGDFVSAGVARLAVIDKDSFWVYGYFEESKLPLIHLGDPVDIRLLGSKTTLSGHIESLSRGITDRDNPTGRELLADVNPVFNWVRLAQRVPVRVSIDRIPENTPLAAGMTCTLVVIPGQGNPQRLLDAARSSQKKPINPL